MKKKINVRAEIDPHPPHTLLCFCSFKLANQQGTFDEVKPVYTESFQLVQSLAW